MKLDDDSKRALMEMCVQEGREGKATLSRLVRWWLRQPLPLRLWAIDALVTQQDRYRASVDELLEVLADVCKTHTVGPVADAAEPRRSRAE